MLRSHGADGTFSRNVAQHSFPTTYHLHDVLGNMKTTQLLILMAPADLSAVVTLDSGLGPHYFCRHVILCSPFSATSH